MVILYSRFIASDFVIMQYKTELREKYKTFWYVSSLSSPSLFL